MKQPLYTPFLAAYHRAFATELHRMVSQLPICTGDRVLDIGCGDGIYSEWLIPLVAPMGSVTGVDASDEAIQLAQKRFKNQPYKDLARFMKGDIAHLPFADGYFDVAWCPQNLFSFPDPEQALHELARVVRPGGIVAILENDSLHQVLLSWPIEVELALAQAEWRSFQARSKRPKKFYIARGLRRLLRCVGLKPQRKKVYVSQREAPFTTDENDFLRLYLGSLWKRARPFLKTGERQAIEAYVNPRSPRYLLKQEDLTLTCLDHVVWGKKGH